MGELATEDDARRLRAWATSELDVRVRRRALERLVAILGPEARRDLRALIQAPRTPPKLRRHAARLLGQTGADALETISPLLEYDVEAVREGALAALVRVDSPSAASLLERGVSTAGARARRVVLAAFLDGPSDAALEAAERLIAHPNLPGDDRETLCRVLGARGHRSARGALEALAEAPTTPRGLRRAAAWAVRTLDAPRAERVAPP